jgi:hypothetical protein
MIKLLSVLAALFSQVEAVPEGETAEAVRGPVVVELFTSQGCAMCPDANALLEEIGGADDVIAIAYGVSYWDMYGWSDQFARPEFAARQQAYVDAGEAMRVYTPHFVINGAPEKMRFSAETVRAALGSAAPLPPVITINGGVVRVDGPARGTPAQIWRVDYAPGAVSRQISGGANAGRDMEHFNMASAVTRLGDWTGGAMTVSLDPVNEGGACAILIQDGPGGRILAAARLD